MQETSFSFNLLRNIGTLEVEKHSFAKYNNEFNFVQNVVATCNKSGNISYNTFQHAMRHCWTISWKKILSVLLSLLPKILYNFKTYFQDQNHIFPNNFHTFWTSPLGRRDLINWYLLGIKENPFQGGQKQQISQNVKRKVKRIKLLMSLLTCAAFCFSSHCLSLSALSSSTTLLSFSFKFLSFC